MRDLLVGQLVDVDGRYVTLHGLRLDWPPARPPSLLIGAGGPKTVALAAEISDGVLLDSVADADDVRRVRERWTPLPGRPSSRSTRSSTPRTTRRASARDWPTGPRCRARPGADTVVFQATADHPDPRPLIEAISLS